MHKIKKKKQKGHCMIDNLKKQVYGFCCDKQGIQLWHSLERDKGLPENRPERDKAIFETHMNMWFNAIALMMPIREMLIEYKPNLADIMPIPQFMNNPENQPAKVNVLKGKLWELTYGFYMDNEQGLWLWIDSESMCKKDVVEALVELMEYAERCVKAIRELIADQFPGVRKMLADSGMYPEYEIWSDKE